MLTPPSSEPKPVTDWWRPDLVKLPELTLTRRLFRLFARGLAKLLVFFTLKVTVRGLENFPQHGPALIVINHLGDADAVLLAAVLPTAIDGMGKIELDEHWLVGPVFRAYGVIYVHRGRPDRREPRGQFRGRPPVPGLPHDGDCLGRRHREAGGCLAMGFWTTATDRKSYLSASYRHHKFFNEGSTQQGSGRPLLWSAPPSSNIQNISATLEGQMITAGFGKLSFIQGQLFKMV